MASKEQIELVVKAVTSAATKEMQKFNKSLGKTKTTTKKTDTSFKSFGKTLKAASVQWIALTAAVAGFAVVVNKSIQDASRLQESTNKFNVVFASVIDTARDVAEALSESYGLSKRESMDLLSNTADLLTGFGLTADAALALSTRVQTLAVDMASFMNIEGGAERASKALTKAMLGEKEMLKELNVVLLDKDINLALAAKGMDKLTGEARLQAKALVTLELATKQSKNSMGDFARSMDSYANQSRILDAELENLSATMGNSLLPMATDIKTALVGLLKLPGKLAVAWANMSMELDVAFAKLKFQVIDASAAVSKYVNKDLAAATQRAADLAEYQYLAKAIALEKERIAQEEFFNGKNEALQEQLNKEIEIVQSADELKKVAAEKALKEEKKRLEKTAKNYFTFKSQLKKYDDIFLKHKDKNRGLDFQSHQSWSSFMMNSMDKTNKTQFKIWKAFAVQQSIINTHAAAIAGYKAMVGIPIVGPGLAAVAAGLAIAAGTLQTQRILATPMPAAEHGAVIQGSMAGTALLAGENSKDELVLPLEDEAGQEAIQSAVGGGGVTIHIENFYGEGDELSQRFIDEVDKGLSELSRRGESRVL